MVSAIVFCRKCNQELTGAIERVLAREGNYVVIVSRETIDCNWRECRGCGTIICKRCYAVQPLYCCSVDKIIAAERTETNIKDRRDVANEARREVSAAARKTVRQLLDGSRSVLRRTNSNRYPHHQDKNTNNRR
jgi:hypothetical protein